MNLKSEDIGYFNLSLVLNLMISDSRIIQVERNLYFMNILLFTKKLKDILATRDLAQVRILVLSYFRGIVSL